MSRRRQVWPAGTRWLAVGIAAVLLALAVAWVLFVPTADWLARHDVGSAHGALLQTARDDARGRLLTLGAGLLAASALLFTARNFTVSRRTFELTEQGQVTDRYTKAIEQLGSDKLDVRIGGIYALERVARDSARDHPTVMEVLTAFIREHSREPWPEPDPDGRELEQSIRPDVQAAVTVVGRRDPSRDVQRIDLSRAKLLGADLTGADLTGADLTGADLTAVDLVGVDLSGVDFTNANLSAANLLGAKLSGAKLSGAKLSGAKLSAANLLGANLLGANLSGANLFGANLANADLTNANLSGAYLFGAYLAVANLSMADLTWADLTNADLTGANLGVAKLTNVKLTNANWPEGKTVPKGWKRDPDSGQLSREN